MPKLSPAADRILFLGACCLIGIFSISVWWWVFSGPQKSPAVRPQPVTEIPVNETVRKVWDSGLSTEYPLSIYWLDDETLLFTANNGPKPRTQQELRSRETWLYLWRLGEKPRPYGKDPHMAARRPHCAAHGEISYHLDIVDPDSGKTSQTRWLGPPDREREVAPSPIVLDRRGANPPGTPMNFRSIEKVDCEIYVDPAMAGKFYVTDSKHRFYLDFGTENPAMVAVHARPEQPIALLRSDGSGRVALPISSADATPGSTHFHRFDGAFYLLNENLTASPVNHFELWRETNCWPIWRVDPQIAKTVRLCIPFGPWSGRHGTSTLVHLAPTRAGLFFNAINAKDESGFYRLENGIVSRIFLGDMWDLALSPNGCRIAFTRTDNERFGFSVFWKSILAIDLCSPKASISSSSN